MKAEHRKELETNTLADKMGHMMKRVKTGRRSTFMVYVLVGGAAAIGLWLLYASMTSSKIETSDRWLRLDDGGQKNLVELATKEGTTPAGKAARLQLAWLFYWELGLKKLGADPHDAMLKINTAGDLYRELAKDCADDPLFHPQALLGIAVIEETRALQDQLVLDKAVEAYKELRADKYKDTAEGVFAKERIDQLTDKKQRAEIAGIYDEVQRMLKVPAIQRQPKLLELPPNHPPFFEKK